MKETANKLFLKPYFSAFYKKVISLTPPQLIKTGLVFGILTFVFISNSAVPIRQKRYFVPRRGEINLQGAFHKTDFNYDLSGGAFTRLDSGSSYQIYDYDLASRVAISKKMAVYGWGRLSNAESKRDFKVRNNSAVHQLVVGMEYLLDPSQITWIPDFSVAIPLKNQNFSGDEVAVGEGVTEITAKMRGQILKPSWYIDGGVGVTYRDQNRSTLMPVNLGVHFNISKTMLIGADLNGYYTISKENESALARNVYACRVNGCSLRFGSVNPNLLEATGALQIYASQRSLIRLDVGQSITGYNVAGGPIVAINFSYLFGLSQSNTFSNPEQNIYEDPSPEFVPDKNHDVDHSQFAPDHTGGVVPTTKTPQPVNTNVVKPKPPVREQMKNELDQTEMQIELKSTPKKK